jgi:hypothetical protein
VDISAVPSRWLLGAVNHAADPWETDGDHDREGGNMSKRARKRRDRKKGGANHGKRPNT